MADTYGILGWPVAHSRSPQMQRAAFASAGLEADYVRFPVRPEALADAVRGLFALGVAGANVTVPHKEAVLPLLSTVSPQARAIGAVNTLVRREQGFEGHNTDGAGLCRSLLEAGVSLEGSRVVMLGAGGAARAVVAGLAEHGARALHVAARRPEQARALIADLAPVCGDCALTAGPLDGARETFEGASLLVQSTSATLEGSPHAEPFAAALPMDALPPAAAVVDLVYKPRETSVLRRARERGLTCVEGTGMLVHQGALAFELWTGQAADVAAMRAALEASL